MENQSSIIYKSGTGVSRKQGGKSRKPYHQPHLNELGDLRSLTLGPTFGRAESGPLDTVHKSPWGP